WHVRSSFLFHDTLQRVLVLAGEIHHLCHFGFGNLVGEHTTLAYAMIVHMKHDPCGRFAILLEKTFQDMDHELHGRIVVVEKQDAVQAWLLGLWLRAGNDGGAATGSVAALIAILHPNPSHIHSCSFP